jgi:hypothetical protein
MPKTPIPPAVDKTNLFPSQVVALCPSCGLVTAAGPHGSSEECVRALEAEVQRLSAALERFKNAARQITRASRGKP